MNRLYISVLCATLPVVAFAQEAVDVQKLSDTELRGTAKHISMAGATGAIGGDMSSVLVNPGGIGVYRSCDVSITPTLNIMTSNSGALRRTDTKGTVNSAGFIASIRTNGESVRNINFGFSYNRIMDFNRSQVGTTTLNTSYSNAIAAMTNLRNISKSDIDAGGFNGYAPWSTVMAYGAGTISPSSDGRNFHGLFTDNTSGYANFRTVESGAVDEFAISIGGNTYDRFYWGATVGIVDMVYRNSTYYGESLTNANLRGLIDNVTTGSAVVAMNNQLLTRGTGVNVKAGFIYRPLPQVRLGFAVHTPTWYTLRDYYSAYTDAEYRWDSGYKAHSSDTPTTYYTRYKIRTPWKFVVSAAGVIGRYAIISIDYQFDGYNTMNCEDTNGNQVVSVRNRISDYYQPMHTVRIGAEFRLTSSLSLRGGYSYQTSPLRDETFRSDKEIATSGTMLYYALPHDTQYFTAGIGYKWRNFYIDLAYLRKVREYDYYSFSSNICASIYSPKTKVTNRTNQLALTLGFRF